MPVDVLAPPLGTNVDTLTLISWYKRVGERVTKDEPLFVVETDKATLDVEAPASGILYRIDAQPGAEVIALTRIATILTPDEGMEPDTARQGAAAADRPTAVSSAGAPASREPVSGSPPESLAQNRTGRILISPRAKRLAEAHQVTWQALDGTGPEQAIVERDVLAYLDTAPRKTVTPVARRMATSSGVDWEQLAGTGRGGKVVRADVTAELQARQPPNPGPGADPEDGDGVQETVPLAGIREIIAAHMMQSVSTTAAVTLTSEADASGLVELRARLAADGLKVSYNALLLRVLARSLQEHPRMNASLQGDSITIYRHVHIGVAVHSESGLRVPVLRHVDRLGLAAIEEHLARCVETAREGRTPPEVMRGGTFTLTNLGMFGIDMFTPIINTPECAILGVGRISPQPSVFDGQVVVRSKVWLSLTFDHRLVDGGPAALFLQRVIQFVEKPHLLLT